MAIHAHDKGILRSAGQAIQVLLRGLLTIALVIGLPILAAVAFARTQAANADRHAVAEKIAQIQALGSDLQFQIEAAPAFVNAFAAQIDPNLSDWKKRSLGRKVRNARIGDYRVVCVDKESNKKGLFDKEDKSYLIAVTKLGDAAREASNCVRGRLKGFDLRRFIDSSPVAKDFTTLVLVKVADGRLEPVISDRSALGIDVSSLLSPPVRSKTEERATAADGKTKDDADSDANDGADRLADGIRALGNFGRLLAPADLNERGSRCPRGADGEVRLPTATCLLAVETSTGDALAFVQPLHVTVNLEGQASEAVSEQAESVSLLLVGVVPHEALRANGGRTPPMLRLTFACAALAGVGILMFLRLRHAGPTWSFGGPWLFGMVIGFCLVLVAAWAMGAALLARATEEWRLHNTASLVAEQMVARIISDLEKVQEHLEERQLHTAMSTDAPAENDTDPFAILDKCPPQANVLPAIRTSAQINEGGYSHGKGCLTLCQTEESKSCVFSAGKRGYFDELKAGETRSSLNSMPVAVDHLRAQTQGDLQTVVAVAAGGKSPYAFMASADLLAMQGPVLPPGVFHAVVAGPDVHLGRDAGQVLAHSERWRALDTRFGDRLVPMNTGRTPMDLLLRSASARYEGWFREGGEQQWMVALPVAKLPVANEKSSIPWRVVAGFGMDRADAHGAKAGRRVLENGLVGLGATVLGLGLLRLFSWRLGWLKRLWPAPQSAGFHASGFWPLAVLAAVSAACVCTIAWHANRFCAVVALGVFLTLGVIMLFWLCWRALRKEKRESVNPIKWLKAAPGLLWGRTRPTPLPLEGVGGLSPEQSAKYRRFVLALVAALLLPVLGLTTGHELNRGEPVAESENKGRSVVEVERRALIAGQEIEADRAVRSALRNYKQEGMSWRRTAIRFPTKPDASAASTKEGRELSMWFEDENGEQRLQMSRGVPPLRNMVWLWLLGLAVTAVGFTVWAWKLAARAILGFDLAVAAGPPVEKPTREILVEDMEKPFADAAWRRVMLVEPYPETLRLFAAAATGAFGPSAVQVIDLRIFMADSAPAEPITPTVDKAVRLLVLKNFEVLLSDTMKRLAALGWMERQNECESRSIWLVMQSPPLERIRVAREKDRRRAMQTNGKNGDASVPTRDRTVLANEEYRWSVLLGGFRTIMEPNSFRRFEAAQIKQDSLKPVPFEQIEVLVCELSAVEDLDGDGGTGQHFMLGQQPPSSWGPFLARYGAEYFRRAYQLRSDEEREVLQGMAAGHWVRTDTRAVQSLLDSGLAIRRPWPTLPGEGWRAFLKSAEADLDLVRVPEGNWKSIRRVGVPLLGAIILGLVLLDPSAPDRIVPILAAAAGLLGVWLQLESSWSKGQGDTG